MERVLVKKRSISVMGDDERALIGRDRRPQEYPIQQIDPEQTPAPAFVTPEPTLDVHEQLRLLAEGLGDVTTGLGRLWDMRKDSDKISKLDAKFDTLVANDAQHYAAIEEFLKPSVKGLMSRLDILLTHHETTKADIAAFYDHQWPEARSAIGDLRSTVNDLRSAVGDLRLAIERLASAQSVLDAKQAASATIAAALETRVGYIERRFVEKDAGDKRQAKLFSWARAGLVGIAAAVGFVASQFESIVDWLRR